jgi:catechol 2,3-dioxygenase-like lactoylglutathione lyase family enzyme
MVSHSPLVKLLDNEVSPSVLLSGRGYPPQYCSFFIVENLQASLDFYQSKLGFEIAYKGGGDGHSEDFWAFVRRDGVMVNLKQIAPEIHPEPNHSRHEWARGHAYIHTSDPDSLYEEYISEPLRYTSP